MILILTDTEEATSDLIIDWLLYFKKDFIRISNENTIYVKEIYETITGFEAILDIEFNRVIRSIDTFDIQSYWYRRSDLFINIPLIKTENEQIQIALQRHLNYEYISIARIINNILNRKLTINKYNDNNISKLGILQYAKDSGMQIPHTIICKDKITLMDFYEKHNHKIITKNIGDPFGLEKINFHCYTSKVNIDDIPDYFALSLFQEMIDKKIELRIFYLHKEIYSSAIFSQRDVQTQVDFRHYNSKKPNRVIPYKLPQEIENKIHKLMSLCDLNSGSIDMVLTTKNEYVFLEVNPIGQFEQVSMPCNYNLFKRIAEIL
ncbi:MAG: grasp-with-spasm system ATP-grasp peptide maturase [Elusimicrobiota bacterium]|jgi:ATP-GRASP peptide maturase of grasp-with-spasm system|nr:grasp-with-spasm system ATP-grasp peptide maturase [Elusimicrobiota bacterium]